ncbi:complement factor B [Rhipicephalus sanguineus]|uniref:complement factor B n=1 Tax=Rhipicephalus sanguineus TaxID=34632 RepID=UPI00189424DF|nr:complement factor B [Rhipicephalus sanguineus]
MDVLRLHGLVFSLLLIEASSAIPQAPPCTVPPPELPNGTCIPVPEQRMALYNCLEGFWISGSESLTCVTSSDGNDIWLPEDWPQCHLIEECPDIELENGYYDGDCCAPGDEAFFFCNDEERYRLLGEKSAVCLQSGNWSAPIPTCQDTYCKDPGTSEKGIRYLFKGSTLYDDCSPDGCAPEIVASYLCDENFELVGERTITCTENGTWTHTRPKCRPHSYCDDFHVVNGEVFGERSGGEYFTPGDSAFITCAPGYRVNGTDQLYCEEEGFWDDDVPTCVESTCTRFEPAPHLIVYEFLNDNRTSFAEGTAINFNCEVGYQLRGAVFSTVCKNGGWIGRLPKCEEIRCGPLRAPVHGSMRGNYSTAVDATVEFGCFQGYTLLGPSRRTCGFNGQWDGEPVRCISNALLASQRRNGCEDPGTPDNGVRYGRPSYSVGSHIKFACNPGYYMRGNDTIRCEENRQWSARIPLCLGKFYYDTPRSVNNIITQEVGAISKPANTTVIDNGKAEGRTINLNKENVYPHYVYFLFDGSTSIGQKNFRTGISLAKAITRKLNVNHTEHRVGAIVFNKTAEWGIRPDENANEENVLKKFDALKFTSGGTSISAALKLLTESIARTRHKNRAIKFAAFLITDGKANIGGGAEKDADMLKKQYGVDVYCIGITGALHMETLNKIASKQENVFVLRNYDSLQWLADTLTNGTIDYSVCGVSYSHDPETGLDVDDRKAEGRILGGTQVVTVWPWMVEIGLVGESEALCGGTIIHKKFVLTAAHCMHSKNATRNEFTAGNLRLRAGLIARNVKNVTKLQVQRIIMHEQYNRLNDTFHNDIALLQLKEEISFVRDVRPICLPPPKDQMRGKVFYKKDATAFVIGWGEDGIRKGKSRSHLMQLETKIASCSSNAPNLHEGMMCSSSSKGDVCNGDSGGPLMQGVHSDEKIWTQVGIVSWGKGACSKNKTSYYTDVSFYIKWIQSHITNASIPAAPKEAP